MGHIACRTAARAGPDRPGRLSRRLTAHGLCQARRWSSAAARRLGGARRSPAGARYGSGPGPPGSELAARRRPRSGRPPRTGMLGGLRVGQGMLSDLLSGSLLGGRDLSRPLGRPGCRQGLISGGSATSTNARASRWAEVTSARNDTKRNVGSAVALAQSGLLGCGCVPSAGIHRSRASRRPSGHAVRSQVAPNRGTRSQREFLLQL
jgi:hypothetical protein